MSSSLLPAAGLQGSSAVAKKPSEVGLTTIEPNSVNSLNNGVETGSSLSPSKQIKIQRVSVHIARKKIGRKKSFVYFVFQNENGSARKMMSNLVKRPPVDIEFEDVVFTVDERSIGRRIFSKNMEGSKIILKVKLRQRAL